MVSIRKPASGPAFQIVAEADARLPEIFALRPRAAVTVERVPEFRQHGAAGAYYQPPSFDGSRPGTFYANLANVEETARWRMRTLLPRRALGQARVGRLRSSISSRLF